MERRDLLDQSLNQRKTIAADSVILACGTAESRALADALAGLVPEVHVINDQRDERETMIPSYVEIQNLIGMYAERIDSGDFAGVADLFAHAVITSEGSQARAEGAKEVQTRYEQWTRRFTDDGTPHTKHVTTNLIIDIDEDAGTGTCRSYCTVFQQTPTLPLQPIYQGRYHDRFERVDGKWRFAHRHMINDRLGDLSQHLLQNISQA